MTPPPPGQRTTTWPGHHFPNADGKLRWQPFMSSPNKLLFFFKQSNFHYSTPIPTRIHSTPSPSLPHSFSKVPSEPTNIHPTSQKSVNRIPFILLSRIVLPYSSRSFTFKPKHHSLGGFFLMGYLSCKAQSSVAVSNPHSHSDTHNNTRTPPVTPSKPANIEEFEYKDLQLATSNFSDQKLLGRGSHGLVYKAVLRSGRLVAVKKPSRRLPSTPGTASPVIELENEFHILSNLHSPRFVNLLGYSSTCSSSIPNLSSERLLVVEFMSNGTLYDLLHKNPKPPNWGRRIRIALQTAKAVETLHSQFPPVIHRDIKSANILIDANHNARLGDFGLALKCYIDEYHKLPSTPPAGTMGYLDPLYVTAENLSTKADVFSFGILLLEIISGRKAIDVVHSPPSIIDWAIPLIRKEKQLLLSILDPRIPPPKDALVSKQLAVIAAKCVRSCRERRPSMKEVVKALDGLTKLVPLKSSWNGLGLAASNPCSVVVDSVVNPVELASAAHLAVNSRRLRGFECGNPNDVMELLRSSKRVYSDLGFRNNLKDLMAKPDDEADVTNKPRSLVTRGSSFRIISDRLVPRSRGGAQLRRNQSSHLD